VKVLGTGCLTLLEDIQIILSLLRVWLFRLSHSFIFFCLHLLSFYIWFNVLYASVKLCKLCVFIVMFMYSYCYVCNILCILFHFVVLYIVCVEMCDVLLPPGVNPTAVNKYIIYEKGGRGLICAEVLYKISNISEFLLFGLRFITGSSRI
jgi:hypothetical protein